MASAVEQKVKQIIVEQLGVDESQVDNKASFVCDDLGADSLDIVELVYGLRRSASSWRSPTKTPKRSGTASAMPSPTSKTRKSSRSGRHPRVCAVRRNKLQPRHPDPWQRHLNSA